MTSNSQTASDQADSTDDFFYFLNIEDFIAAQPSSKMTFHERARSFRELVATFDEKFPYQDRSETDPDSIDCRKLSLREINIIFRYLTGKRMQSNVARWHYISAIKHVVFSNVFIGEHECDSDDDEPYDPRFKYFIVQRCYTRWQRNKFITSIDGRCDCE